MTERPGAPPRLANNMDSGPVVTVGTFDGVHRGHQELIATVRRKAAEVGRDAVLVTFEPHPLEVVRPASAPRLLTTVAEKSDILAGTGLDRVVVLPFDRHLASLEPRDFVEQILLGRLRMSHLVIGYDHGFGRGRSGDATTLREIGNEVGFGVDVVAPVMLDGAPLSSSRIREALQHGDMLSAAVALGRPYSITGTVVHGAGRGRDLGFPTANLRVQGARKLVPLDGIYAVRADVSGTARDGLLHIGPRPTFGEVERTVELYLLDFTGDLYAETLLVRFCARIRGVQSFGSAEALVRAMRADVEAARRVFAEGGHACGTTTSGLQSKA